jgi:hypothetical protein
LFKRISQEEVEMSESATVLTFRQVISSLKKKILEGITLQSQNTNQVQEVQKVFRELHHAIRKVVEKKGPISTLEPYSLDILLRDILSKSLSDDDRDLMMYYLRRDLITYPFTIDTIHINSNLVENKKEE